MKIVKYSILASNANTLNFDPRLHKILVGKWADLLNKYNYKGLPTPLIGAMGAAGVRVQLGSDAKAIKTSQKSYQILVDKYLSNGGKSCLLAKAKTVGLDYKTKKLSCK